MRRQRLLRLGLVWWALTSVIPHPAYSQKENPSEYQVKAAFLYHFASFVEWPERAASEEPFRICVLGTDPFRSDLERTLGGKSIQNRPVVSRRLSNPGEAVGCRIVFISPSEEDRYADLFNTLHRKNILTVGESRRFAEQGGVIQFILVEGKVRFAINVTAGRHAGLKLSSKLLNLATEVLVD